MRDLVLGFTFLGLLAFRVVAQAPPPPVTTDSVLLTLTVNAAYEDTDSSLNRLITLTELLPPTRIDSRRFPSLPALIFKRYGVSPGHRGSSTSLIFQGPTSSLKRRLFVSTASRSQPIRFPEGS